MYENITGNQEEDHRAFAALVNTIASHLDHGGVLVSVEPKQLRTWFDTIAAHFRPGPSGRVTFFDAMGRVAEVTAMTATLD